LFCRFDTPTKVVSKTPEGMPSGVFSCALLLPFYVHSYLPKTVHLYFPITVADMQLEPKKRIEKIVKQTYGGRHSGTWMHRILAVKFAAWLSPEFELWVYRTVDEILFGNYRQVEQSIRQSARRRNRIEELRKELQKSDVYSELASLEQEERKAANHRSKFNRNQLDLFRSLN
jgi:hypothetical protein